MVTERRYFGTDGIRCVAGQAPLNPETLVRLGKAIAQVFQGKKGKRHILIGKDTRLSGYMIEDALAAGIISMGADVWIIGPLPTPGVAYLTKSMRADAGIVISASHNPFEDNGIKIFGADGFKLDDQKELEIEALLDTNSLDQQCAEPGLIGKATRIDDAVGRYTVYLKECFPRQFSLEELKIGFDGANGAGYVVGPQVLSELGADVSSRGVSPNGKNINSGFGSLYPEVVAKLVVERNLDLGIAVDGDADRVVLVDDKGKIVDGDMIMAICALDLKEQGLLRKNVVVGTVMSNLGLEVLLNKNDIQLIRTQVGDRYVLEEMQKLDAQVGGEQSGHAIFTDYSTTGDGILTALMVAAIMCRTGKRLSELTSDFVRYPQKLININVSQKPSFDAISPIKEVIEKFEQTLEQRGRILVRYSGTENKARVMVECEQEDECKQIAQEVAEVIEKELGTT